MPPLNIPQSYTASSSTSRSYNLAQLMDFSLSFTPLLLPLSLVISPIFFLLSIIYNIFNITNKNYNQPPQQSTIKIIHFPLVFIRPQIFGCLLSFSISFQSVYSYIMASAILVGRSFIFDQKQDLLLIIIVIDNHMEVKTSKAGKGKDNPEELWQNSYSWPKCIWEMSYLTFSFVLWYFLIQETVKDHKGPLPVVLGFIAANFFVDWISGMLHWAADTWGHFKTPIFGPTIIRSFRMHHLDPQDITKHSFAQTNAATSYPAPFVITLAYYSSSGSFLSQTYNWMIIFSLILGILTNEIHKWSHMVHSKPHPVVRFFQQSGLIISHEVHHKHHTGKFDTEYCIINGWCNPFLQRIDYWRRLQRLITKLTGAIPRQDDEYWRNLKQVQQ